MPAIHRGPVQVVQWQTVWQTLSTKDYLSRWVMVRGVQCPKFNDVEAEDHVFTSRGVAKTFWKLVSQDFGMVGLSPCASGHRAPGSTFSRLRLAAGEYFLWRNQCFAVLPQQCIQVMWQPLSRLEEPV